MAQQPLATAGPRCLQASEFFTEVLTPTPRIAVFDCDGTLWSGDAGSSFMWWSMQTGLLSTERANHLRSRYDAYLRGDVSELAICGEMVQIYAGLPQDVMRSSAARFFSEAIESQLFLDLKALVAELQQRSTDIWAVSSTNTWVVEEGVRRFGIKADRVLAARVSVEGGRLTDHLIDVPTDEGKVAALRAAGVQTPDVVFGNSVHDAAMLAIARRAFPVNPSAALRERAGRERWPVFYPAGVVQPATDKHEQHG